MTRPVLDHIVEQHAEETAFLWSLRDAATTAPHYKRHHLARLDERLEAHVDGLRVAGEAGWQIAVSQLERHSDNGELFSAALLALESGDMRRIEPLAAKLRATPEGRRGFVGAIAWCRSDGPASSCESGIGRRKHACGILICARAQFIGPTPVQAWRSALKTKTPS